jgi:hypothetical protein
MRQYWRDFDSLEAWARAELNQTWRQQFFLTQPERASGMKSTSCAEAVGVLEMGRCERGKGEFKDCG